MNAKERVQLTLAHKTTDRIPIFMWFHPQTAERLSLILELPQALVGQAMGNDICQTWVGNNFAMEGIVHTQDGCTHTDAWGITWERQDGFNQITRSPLEHATEDTVADYHFPAPQIMDELLDNMELLTPHAAKYFIGCDVSPCVFEMSNRLFGMEDMMLRLAEPSTEFLSCLDRAADFNTKLAEKACRRFRPDWLWTGDDVGGQQSMMLSPAMWRSLIKPRLQRIFDVAKQFSVPVAYHSCGALRPIIGDLIEMGMNVLNPIQCGCVGMEAASLKQEFGQQLTFMGGVDTIELLPHGTVAEVRRATRELIDTMAVDGGYILAASHTIPPETPEENIFAMYHEAGLSRECIFDTAATLRACQPQIGARSVLNRRDTTK